MIAWFGVIAALGVFAGSLAVKAWNLLARYAVPDLAESGLEAVSLSAVIILAVSCSAAATPARRAAMADPASLLRSE